MDPTAPAAQDVQKQTPAAQPAADASTVQAGQSQDTTGQQSVTQVKPAPTTPQKTQISVSGSGGLEAGSAVIVQEDADDDDDEKELQAAPQEKRNLGVMGQGEDDEQDEQQVVSNPAVIDTEEEVAEVQPTVPEVVVSSPEVEKLVEITPPEQPKITEELKNVGVTHSGPGFIDASQMQLPPPKMPATYEQVVNAEEQIKNNRLHSSKFWLLEKIKYLWRKVNPNIALTVKKPQTKKVIPVKKLPVKANTVPANNDTVTKSTQVQ
jgi:hypothetical protein